MSVTAFNRARREKDEGAKQEAVNAYIKEANGGKEYDGSDLTEEGTEGEGDTDASATEEKAADEAASEAGEKKTRTRKPKESKEG